MTGPMLWISISTIESQAHSPHRMDVFKEEGSGVKTVIFTGGTGSIALQRGLYYALDSKLDGIETRVIVNAYDNGLSTGAVRRVMNHYSSHGPRRKTVV